MIIRPAVPEDAPQIGAIYFHTIRAVNLRDYTPEQVAAWAPEGSDSPAGWLRKQSSRWTVVADLAGKIVGFGELEPNGHVDCFYVHHEHIRQGIGRRLMESLEGEARSRELGRMFVEVSLTARDFFTSMGFTTIRPQHVSIRGQLLANFVMEKLLEETAQE